jgi:phytoene dehydrogenase-like protein
VTLARFGLRVLQRAPGLARGFTGSAAGALLAGSAAHAAQPLDRLGPAGAGLLLNTLGHAVGWPVVEGGSQKIADAVVADLRARGATLRTGRWVSDLRELPSARVTLLDLSPTQLDALAGDRLPASYRRALARYRYGAGASTVHLVTSEPIPWADERARRAGTVHLGGPGAEVDAAEREVAAGRHAEDPFTLLVQPSVVDPTRAPAGLHPVWSYCHVPAGSDRDVTATLVRRIERYAPGFTDTVLASHVRTAAQLSRDNPVHVGGDVAVGEPRCGRPWPARSPAGTRTRRRCPGCSSAPRHTAGAGGARHERRARRPVGAAVARGALSAREPGRLPLRRAGLRCSGRRRPSRPAAPASRRRGG